MADLDYLIKQFDNFKNQLLTSQHKFIENLNQYISKNDTDIEQEIYFELKKQGDIYNLFYNELNGFIKSNIKFEKENEILICKYHFIQEGPYINNAGAGSWNILIIGIFISNFGNIIHYLFEFRFNCNNCYVHGPPGFINGIKLEKIKHDIHISKDFKIMIQKLFNREIWIQHPLSENSPFKNILYDIPFQNINTLIVLYKFNIFNRLYKSDLIMESKKYEQVNQDLKQQINSQIQEIQIKDNIISKLESKTQELTNKLKKAIPEKYQCVICFEFTEKTRILVPCGHTQYCLVCIESISTCSICRNKITNTIKIYN